LSKSTKPKLLLDENLGRLFIEELRKKGYDVKWVGDVQRGISDEEVARLALTENRVIITQDKDFNVELVRIVKPPGIILLRTFGTKIEERIKILLSVLENKQKELYRHIIVVEKKENAVKVRLRSI